VRTAELKCFARDVGVPDNEEAFGGLGKRAREVWDAASRRGQSSVCGWSEGGSVELLCKSELGVQVCVCEGESGPLTPSPTRLTFNKWRAQFLR